MKSLYYRLDIKLVDFGLAKRLPFGATVLPCKKIIGTEFSLAPEFTKDSLPV